MEELFINNFRIKKLEKEDISSYKVKEFLFKMIQNEFGFSFLPQYYGDIVNMESFYIKPERNCFFLAIES